MQGKASAGWFKIGQGFSWLQSLNSEAVPRAPDKKLTQIAGDCSTVAGFLRQWSRRLKNRMTEFQKLAPKDLGEGSVPADILALIADEVGSLPDDNTKQIVMLVMDCLREAGTGEWGAGALR